MFQVIYKSFLFTDKDTFWTDMQNMNYGENCINLRQYGVMAVHVGRLHWNVSFCHFCEQILIIWDKEEYLPIAY